MMRAAVITGPRATELTSVPTPDPGPGEVLIELEDCGVGGSDLPVWEGRQWFDYPREPGAPGHEGWGRVVAAGARAIAPPPGTRVAAISRRSVAEYDVAAADSVIALPPQLDAVPFPGEPLGSAMNVARRSDLRAGQTVAVVGAGFLGALLIQLACGTGARVIAVSRRPYARQLALAAGAAHALAPGDGVVETVEELTGGRLCDRVIEVTGHQQPLDLAGRLTGVRGRLVIAGLHRDGPRRVDLTLWNRRGIDVVNAHDRSPAAQVRGVLEAADAVADGRLDPSPLYTHEFALSDVDRAYAIAVERPPGFVKALVRL